MYRAYTSRRPSPSSRASYARPGDHRPHREPARGSGVLHAARRAAPPGGSRLLPPIVEAMERPIVMTMAGFGKLPIPFLDVAYGFDGHVHDQDRFRILPVLNDRTEGEFVDPNPINAAALSALGGDGVRMHCHWTDHWS